MISEDQRKEILHALNNEMRQRILLMLREKPRTYTWMLEELDVESGHLAYHLRNMGELVKKDKDGAYILSKVGLEAYRFLQEGAPEPKPAKQPALVTASYITAVFLVLIMISYSVYNNSMIEEKEVDRLQTESFKLVGESLEIIYGIFETTDVDRATWTDLVLTLTKLQDRLARLSETNQTYLDYSEKLQTYVDEFTVVLTNSDERYLQLTIEKRQYIRETHYLLVELEAALQLGL